MKMVDNFEEILANENTEEARQNALLPRFRKWLATFWRQIADAWIQAEERPRE